MRQQVTLYYHQEDDGWWADSPDVPGYSAAAASAEDIARMAEAELAAALGTDVELVHLVDIPAGARGLLTITASHPRGESSPPVRWTDWASLVPTTPGWSSNSVPSGV